jgi:hypothetical protein
MSLLPLCPGYCRNPSYRAAPRGPRRISGRVPRNRASPAAGQPHRTSRHASAPQLARQRSKTSVAARDQHRPRACAAADASLGDGMACDRRVCCARARSPRRRRRRASAVGCGEMADFLGSARLGSGLCRVVRWLPLLGMGAPWRWRTRAATSRGTAWPSFSDLVASAYRGAAAVALWPSTVAGWLGGEAAILPKPARRRSDLGVVERVGSSAAAAQWSGLGGGQTTWSGGQRRADYLERRLPLPPPGSSLRAMARAATALSLSLLYAVAPVLFTEERVTKFSCSVFTWLHM